jgi:hypothetical protein
MRNDTLGIARLQFCSRLLQNWILNAHPPVNRCIPRGCNRPVHSYELVPWLSRRWCRCRAALKTENFGNGVGLLHLNRFTVPLLPGPKGREQGVPVEDGDENGCR